MRHAQWLVDKVAVVVFVIVVLAVPLSAYAAAPTDQDSAAATTLLDTLEGSIDVQRGAVNGQVALGRGSVELNAKLADSGPDGQLRLNVPGRFLLSLMAANGNLESTLCGVVGPQEIRTTGGLGSGLHLEFHNAVSNSLACTPATAQELLTMGPIIVAAQAAPASEGVAVPGSLLDGVRRMVILALISGLMFVFVPGLSAPVTAAAQTMPWSRLGLGLCVLITVPVAGVLIFALGFAVGLWWMGLLVLMFFACLLAFSLSMTGLILGAWLLERVRAPRIPLVAAFGIGLVLVTFLGFLPTVGSLVNVVALAYGAGALLLLPRTRAPQSLPAAAAPGVVAVVSPVPSTVVPGSSAF